jgi:nucleotide-binding universal stress UspA family protein
MERDAPPVLLFSTAAAESTCVEARIVIDEVSSLGNGRGKNVPQLVSFLRFSKEKEQLVKILLAIDGSPCSEVAVKEVATMRWPAGTLVKVLSAANVPRPNAPDPLHIVHPMRLKLLEREQTRLRDVARAADWLRDKAVEKSMQIETAVIEGEPKVVIIEEAEQWGADLIVVGCHGYGPIKSFCSARSR